MQYLSIQEASAYLPGRPHANSVRRWMANGVYGVQLRSCRFGGKRLTTKQWCDEFQAALQAASPESQADHAQALAKLDKLGV